MMFVPRYMSAQHLSMFCGLLLAESVRNTGGCLTFSLAPTLVSLLSRLLCACCARAAERAPSTVKIRVSCEGERERERESERGCRRDTRLERWVWFRAGGVGVAFDSVCPDDRLFNRLT